MRQVVIVSGSSRESSQSKKISEYLQAELFKQEESVVANIVDLAKTKLPEWDEAIWHQGIGFNATWQNVSEQLKKADGFIIVSPEWHGMVPAILKNFFLLCSSEELFHKPALLVSVSSGQGGAYPIAELRMSSYKNNRICYLPEHLIIRYVASVLNDFHKVESEQDQVIRDRITYAISVLMVYIDGFKSITEKLLVNKYFSSGM